MTPPHQAQSLLTEPVRGSAAPPPPWIAVSGGKGGVGKTLLAVNVAILAARAGYRTLLADLDPGLANVDVHLRLAPRYRVEDLANGDCSPAEAIVDGPAGVQVLAGQSGSTALAAGDPDVLRAVHTAVTRAARSFDVVICDTGAGIGPAVLQTIEQAALVLAVTTPDPAAVTDAYALIKLLAQRGQPLPHAVINRARGRDHALQTSARLSTVCRKFLGESIPLAGWLRDDPLVGRSVARQRAIALDTNAGEPIEDLRALTAKVLSTVPSVRARNRSRT